jgi:uncharacterized protein (DUF58 family)
MGGYLNGLIFLMFMLSLGYSNNLLLIFTLFLFGLNLVWVIQTHFHLHALKLDTIFIQDGHANEKVLVHIHLKKRPPGPHQWNIQLEGNKSHFIDHCDNTENTIIGQVIFSKRGVLDFQHLKVRTEMPFGLYQAWIYFPVTVKAYVYPAILQNIQLQDFHNSHLEGENSSLKPGPHDIWNLGPYQGEESRKISWKHYARSGELVVKEGEELTQAEVQFNYHGEENDKEYALSKLATLMVQCVRSETAFGLDTPHLKIRPGHNAKHLFECLRELTRC